MMLCSLSVLLLTNVFFRYFTSEFFKTFDTNLQKSTADSDKRDSMSEWEKRLERPSVPLLAKGPPGPPRIVEIEKKYSAIEGTAMHTFSKKSKQSAAFKKIQ